MTLNQLNLVIYYDYAQLNLIWFLSRVLELDPSNYEEPLEMSNSLNKESF